jgi:hypothetical protein
MYKLKIYKRKNRTMEDTFPYWMYIIDMDNLSSITNDIPIMLSIKELNIIKQVIKSIGLALLNIRNESNDVRWICELIIKGNKIKLSKRIIKNYMEII